MHVELSHDNFKWKLYFCGAMGRARHLAHARQVLYYWAVYAAFKIHSKKDWAAQAEHVLIVKVEGAGSRS